VMALNIGLCLLLAPRFAAVGVAVANCSALVVQNLLNQWRLRASIQTRLIDPNCYSAYAAIVVCALVLWGFQALVHPGVVLGVVAAGAASILVLVASRDAMQLAATFPELRRIPLLGKFIR
ncbi:polysaccharide biosynthesis C-terminal domain-containing protein, partial [Bradyrhizobium sp. NBAIM08]|uniref:polysaccharide biosynthesis C-terminal domain-containing protein n=1 Tax=Bradyrhizobium sp. NBAIM08 TaxID=2793815 RepID=UPI001CD4F286